MTGAMRAENAPHWTDTFQLAVREVQLFPVFFFSQSYQPPSTDGTAWQHPTAAHT